MKDIFKNKKANSQKLAKFGFVDKEYSTDILDGSFSLTVKIAKNNEVQTELIEKDTGELYTLHLVEYVQGSFVGKVKREYENILTEIAEKCFEQDVFKSKQSKLVIEYVKDKYGDELEYLWKKFPDNAICRRKDNKKWYLAILTVAKNKFGFETNEKIEIIDLRATTEEIEKFIDNKKYFAGYHMNKKHWLTIILDGSVPIKEIYDRIDISYNIN